MTGKLIPRRRHSGTSKKKGLTGVIKSIPMLGNHKLASTNKKNVDFKEVNRGGKTLTENKYKSKKNLERNERLKTCYLNEEI